MKPTPLSPLAQEVRAHNRDRFLESLFVPPDAREKLLALYGLETELRQVRQAVSEEMIAHIRFAWWQETIEALYKGQLRAGHPTLEALVTIVPNIPQEKLLAVIEDYREHFPLLPGGEKMDTAAQVLVHKLAPQAEKRWGRARGTIARHRRKYAKHNGWLALKLLLTI